MFKLVTVLTVLAFVAGQQALGDDTCISCDWLSPAGSVALFKLNDHMEQSLAAGGAVPMPEDPLKDDTLMDVMEDVVAITDSNTCDEQLAGKLVAMLARLEEGQNPEQKNSVPYEKKGLTNTLEERFVVMLTKCLDQALDLANNAKTNTTVHELTRTFVHFGEFLKERVDEVSAAGKGSVWFSGALASIGRGDISEDDMSPVQYASAILKRAKQIMGFGYLYEKVRDSWASFFNVNAKDGSSCERSIDANLRLKYKPFARELSSVFKPLLTLTGYSPDQFVNVPPGAKKDRQIYEALQHVKDVTKGNSDFSDLVLLHQVLRKTLQRAEEYCPDY